MNRSELIRDVINTLAAEIGPRPAASEGQRRAQEYINGMLREFGFAVEVQETPCPRWELNAVTLSVGARRADVLANPFSPACHVTAPLVRLHSLDELRQADLTGAIAVLAGDLTAAPFSPKNFDIYRDETQDAIVRLLESKAPQAVIAVSRQEAPVPLIEDADFLLPSVTVPNAVGASLETGLTAELRIAAERQPGSAGNIVARGPETTGKRLVVCAHYDTKFITPGAIDNASGVAVLLTLARRLADKTGVELVFFGGEDTWYPCETAYLQRNEEYLQSISAVINVDGVGVAGRRGSVTFLACPDGMVASALRAKAEYSEIAQVEPWYEGDHSLFWPRGIPSLAISTEGAHDLVDRIVHTPLDTPDKVDINAVARIAAYVHDLVVQLK